MTTDEAAKSSRWHWDGAGWGNVLSDVDLRLLHRKMVADKSSAVRNAPPRKPWDMYKKNKNKQTIKKQEPEQVKVRMIKKLDLAKTFHAPNIADNTHTSDNSAPASPDPLVVRSCTVHVESPFINYYIEGLRGDEDKTTSAQWCRQLRNLNTDARTVPESRH